MATVSTSIPKVYIVADNITSPLGHTTAQNLEALKQGYSGVQVYNELHGSTEPVAASIFNGDDAVFRSNADKNYTNFEKLLMASAQNAIKDAGVNFTGKNTILIVSTTKGNIALLQTEPHTAQLMARVALHTSAQLVAGHFGLVNQPIVISNACISGVMAVITGMRLLQSGQYENAIIVGADVMSQFVLSGFQSFRALSAEVCKPFDKDRVGLNLGEGAATIVLSINKQQANNVKVSGGAISNDANHISGPSRTGEELGYAIKKSLLDAGITAHDIDYISAHGTATNYNDEMEANAIHHAGLQHAPVNSLKGYYGHTLGAAGLIESVIAIHAIKSGVIFPSLGYGANGVTKPLNMVQAILNKPVKHALKTASGFGGCNAAIIYSK